MTKQPGIPRASRLFGSRHVPPNPVKVQDAMSEALRRCNRLSREDFSHGRYPTVAPAGVLATAENLEEAREALIPMSREVIMLAAVC